MLPDPTRCLVVEDEEDAANVLRRYLAQTPSLELIGVCRDAAAADRVLRGQQADLLFLDINLPGQSGIDWRRSGGSGVPVIFTTADAGFGAEGFELDAVDYLLKPFSYDRFMRSIDRFLRYRTNQPATTLSVSRPAERPFLMVRVERLLQKIYLDEVQYIEAKGNHLLFFLDDGPVRVYQSVRNIEERLPQPHFLRIHRSFIVATGRVRAFSAAAVHVGACRLPVGRSYQEAVQSALTR